MIDNDAVREIMSTITLVLDENKRWQDSGAKAKLMAEADSMARDDFVHKMQILSAIERVIDIFQGFLTELDEASAREVAAARPHEGAYSPDPANVAMIAKILAASPQRRPRGNPKGGPLDIDAIRFQIIDIYRTVHRKMGHAYTIRQCIKAAEGMPFLPAGREIDALEVSISSGRRKWGKFLHEADKRARRARAVESLKTAQPLPGRRPP